jgi:uncharacterized protein
MTMPMRKILKWIEMVALFIGLPLLYYFDYIPVPKAIPLLVVFIIVLVVLLTDKTFNRKHFWLNSFNQWSWLFKRIGAVSVFLIVFVLLFNREAFFILPRTNPLLWVMIMLFYPIWSAFPQEIIYRGYFFHRFGELFPNVRVMILVNALLFSFSHIIFNNWIALAFTFFASILFSITYRKSNSLAVTFVEHAIYGNLIFTVGLGEFFYVPFN